MCSTCSSLLLHWWYCSMQNFSSQAAVETNGLHVSLVDYGLLNYSSWMCVVYKKLAYVCAWLLHETFTLVLVQTDVIKCLNSLFYFFFHILIILQIEVILLLYNTACIFEVIECICTSYVATIGKFHHLRWHIDLWGRMSQYETVGSKVVF